MSCPTAQPILRSEQPADFDAIDQVNTLAFGRTNEAELVRRLRNEAGFDSQLSLVACMGGDVVGHILFSPATVASATHRDPAMILAPMAVLPDRQRMGVGSSLVRAGLAACRSAGHNLVVVLGHAAYYPRFGFVRASQLGLRLTIDVPDEAFMAIALDANLHPPASGVVDLPRAFDEV